MQEIFTTLRQEGGLRIGLYGNVLWVPDDLPRDEAIEKVLRWVRAQFYRTDGKRLGYDKRYEDSGFQFEREY